jgi:hypothetical protein
VSSSQAAKKTNLPLHLPEKEVGCAGLADPAHQKTQDTPERGAGVASAWNPCNSATLLPAEPACAEPE